MTAQTTPTPKPDTATQIAIGCVVGPILGFIIFVCSMVSSAPGCDPSPQEQATQQSSCRRNLQCWGDQHAAMARLKCVPEVERLAVYSHRWTDGVLESKFPNFRWKDRDSGTLTYMGDKIQFQNGFGAYVNHSYSCDYDPRREIALDVSAVQSSSLR